MSNIEYRNLRSLTARRLIRAPLDDGFLLTSQHGSHHRYHHIDGRRVTVPFTRQGDTFARGTLQSILEMQARWTADDLVRLGLSY